MVKQTRNEQMIQLEGQGLGLLFFNRCSMLHHSNLDWFSVRDLAEVHWWLPAVDLCNRCLARLVSAVTVI